MIWLVHRITWLFQTSVFWKAFWGLFDNRIVSSAKPPTSRSLWAWFQLLPTLDKVNEQEIWLPGVVPEVTIECSWHTSKKTCQKGNYFDFENPRQSWSQKRTCALEIQITLLTKLADVMFKRVSSADTQWTAHLPVSSAIELPIPSFNVFNITSFLWFPGHCFLCEL